MNYESMSNFEINKAAFLLAVKLGFIDFDDIMQNKNPDSDAVMYGDGANWYAWDGCNNPSDSWPIIIENKISIEYDQSEDFWIAHQGEYLIAKYVSQCGYRYQYSDKNPLRAAMIVFLMMSESK